ncbi:MAG: ABC transporter substrate-binding protein [Pseudonocardia sp.]
MTDRLGNTVTTGVSRRSFLRYATILSAGTALTASLGACGGTSNSGGAAGSGTAIGTAADPQGTITATSAFLFNGGFDPMNTSGAVGTCVNQHVFEALVDLDPISREPYPALAKQMPTVGEDGRTWTATLRDGATFSDGTPVTAEDVAWSFSRVLDPANNAIVAPFVTFLESVTATDATTVKFTLTAPFALFAERIAVIKIVPKALTGDAEAATAFDAAPIGSGPFRLESASVTNGVVMANNSHYNGSRPALVTTIALRSSNDNSARLNDLEGGLSQAIEAVPYLNAPTLQGSEFQVDTQQAFNLMYILFNCSAPPFDDKRVRQALFHAIDTQKVITTALNGYGTAATSYLDEANPNYQRAATVYAYDPDKARSLLAAAGVTNLSFEFVTTNAAFIADSAPIIIDAWKEIGVHATLNTAPTSTVLSQLVPADTFRVLAGSGDPTVYGPDTDLLLRWFYYGGQWMTDRCRWNDPALARLTALIEQAATQAGAEQKATWKQAFDLISDEVPLYPLFHTKTVTASDPRALTDFRGAATTGLYFLGTGRTA